MIDAWGAGGGSGKGPGMCATEPSPHSAYHLAPSGETSYIVSPMDWPADPSLVRRKQSGPKTGNSQGSLMFVFTRRAIQEMVGEIAPWMPSAALAELVARLNVPRTNRLPQMWEVVWLYALAQVTDVEHEREFSGKKPDLFFAVDVGGRSVPVLADITTVSDIDLHAENPFEKLTNAVHTQAAKFGHEGGGFRVDVEHQTRVTKHGEKVQLLIPTGNAFDDLVKRVIRPFVQQIAKLPSQTRSLQVDEPGAKFSVTYSGPSQYSQGSHRAYDSVMTLERNVLFNRLADKKIQLRGAPENAVRMLVVCDGDCALLGRGTRRLEGFSAGQVAERFLNGTSSVDLVLLVTVEKESSSIFHRNNAMYINATLVGPSNPPSARLGVEERAAITGLLGEAVSRLPAPVLMPNNALRRNLDSEWSASMVGGMKIDGVQIRVSARAVLELLSGEMTYERFWELHRLSGGERNIFSSRLLSGQLIRRTELESSGQESDDDWLMFEFGPPDPAVSIFKVPATSPSVVADTEGLSEPHALRG